MTMVSSQCGCVCHGARGCGTAGSMFVKGLVAESASHSKPIMPDFSLQMVAGFTLCMTASAKIQMTAMGCSQSGRSIVMK